jgi:membrane-bound lytic murein transglycosylase B
MDFLKNLLSEPFVLGLIVGLLPTALAWKSALAARFLAKKERQKHEKELSELKSHLQTQLKINASGNETLQKELDQLRTQNETLRINLAASQQKPGRAEMRHLQITEAAVATMREQAPGFAQAWERALRDAEQQAEQQDKGLVKLVRRMIPRLGQGKTKSESSAGEPPTSQD